MEQIIKQNTFSRTVFNDSKLGAYYTDPVHATKIGRLFRLQGECCVLEPSFGNAEALKAFLSQCERADEVGSVHTFGVELNRETFEQYKQEIEFPVCADFIGGIRASNRSFTLCFANPPYGVGGDDGSTRLERLFVERIPTLYLEEKIVDMTNILMVLATSFTTNGMVGEFEPTEYSRIKSIISKNVRKIYADCGLRDKDAASLYETVPASGGSFGSGRRKKRLPQMHDFYRAILLDARENVDNFKENAFSLLLDIFEDRVREMYYCPHCMKEFTREELSTLKRTERGAHVCNNHEEGKIYYLREIHGSQAYLDCQSTLSIDMSLPFHNFDLSQITDETERINMIMVVQSYIEENFIKKNSTNPNKARKLIVSTDEAHRILKFEGARMFENALYRVARKRHTAPWLILQSVKDFAKYQDTEEILKSTETFMLFRHNYLDGQYIKDTTNLTQSQVDTVLNLGGTSEAKKYGELCLVDIPTKRAVFIQADYLKDSEFDVVETDVEKIAEHARMKQGA